MESTIGVICSCAPAFSQSLRHNLPAYESFKSKLSSLVGSKRSTALSGEKSDLSGRSGRPGSNPSDKYYIVSDISLPDNEHNIGAQGYELGSVPTVQTFVGNGSQADDVEKGIRMKYEISQRQESRSAMTLDL